MKNPRSRCLVFLTASLLAGCASSGNQATAEKKSDSSDGYADYVPTGSHISDRVSKKQVKPSTEKTTHDQELMHEMQQQQPDPQGPLPR